MPPKCIAWGRYRPNATRDTSRSVSAIMRCTTEIVQPVDTAAIPDGDQQAVTKMGARNTSSSQTDSGADFGSDFRCICSVFFALFFQRSIGHRSRLNVGVSGPREFDVKSHAPIIPF